MNSISFVNSLVEWFEFQSWQLKAATFIRRNGENGMSYYSCGLQLISWLNKRDGNYSLNSSVYWNN